MGDLVPYLLPTLLSVAVLTAIATAVAFAYGVGSPWAGAWAVLRGTLQLALLSLVLGGVIASPLWVALAVVVMFAFAVYTASRRLGGGWRLRARVGSAMAAGVATSLVVVFATGTVEFAPRYVLAVGGIVIGNTMTVASIAGARFTDALVDHWEEVEGWLALGARPRVATLPQARLAVQRALTPSIDQTKTTGLVILPGAFVGAIFGGLSPLEAGRFQIVVLAAILAAASITAVLVVRQSADVRIRPVPLH